MKVRWTKLVNQLNPSSLSLKKHTVFSVTAQRGGKITKSAIATPGVSDLAVKTVKMEGSYRGGGG